MSGPAPLPDGAFESASRAGTDPATRFECGVCWQVYDPAIGDPQSQVAAGTPFTQLPAQWVCPGCEAPHHKFMPLPD